MSKEAEALGRNLIRDVFCVRRDAPRFKHADLISIRDRAIQRFVGYSPHCRLEGMTVDLTEHEKRDLAFFEAAVEVLNSLGVVDKSKLEAVMPRPYTAFYEMLDQEQVQHNFTQQKK